MAAILVLVLVEVQENSFHGIRYLKEMTEKLRTHDILSHSLSYLYHQ